MFVYNVFMHFTKGGIKMKIKILTLVIVAILAITGCSKDSTTKQESKGEQPKIVKVLIKKEDAKNFYVVTTAEGKELTYAYYVYKDKKLLKKFPYKQDAHFAYKISKPGVYKVRVFVRDKNKKIEAKTTNSIRM
jgi:major membrane immunogen (membrane-anchored lipoprotein)